MVVGEGHAHVGLKGVVYTHTAHNPLFQPWNCLPPHTNTPCTIASDCHCHHYHRCRQETGPTRLHHTGTHGAALPVVSINAEHR